MWLHARWAQHLSILIGDIVEQDVAFMAATMASLQEADAKLSALIDSVTNLVTTEARATQATIAAAIASANHPTQPDSPRRDDDGDDDGATTVPSAMAAVKRTLVRLARHAGLLPQLGLVSCRFVYVYSICSYLAGSWVVRKERCLVPLCSSC